MWPLSQRGTAGVKILKWVPVLWSTGQAAAHADAGQNLPQIVLTFRCTAQLAGPVRGSSRPPAREAATNQVFRCAHQLAGVAQSSGVPVHGAVLQAGRFHSQVLMSLHGQSVPQGASGSGYRLVILSRSCGGCIYTKATMLRRRSAAAVHAVATLRRLACSSIL